MSMYTEAQWQNTKTKKRIHGSWIYNRYKDRFYIKLSPDKRSGVPVGFEVSNDSPEWGDWKLVRSRTKTNTRTK